MTRAPTWDVLPDEILLEVCQYLLNVDILYSFFDLNFRMRRMVFQYYRNVSLHKASIVQSTYLCTHVLPHIGFHIRSIVVDRCYAVMQHELFLRHFRERMATVFPNLQKIVLVGFQYSHLMAFLESLRDLEQLHEINLHDLFAIGEDHQADLLRALLQANSSRLTCVSVDNGSSVLKVHPNDCYANISCLSIALAKASQLPVLFAAVPSVRHLKILLSEEGIGNIAWDEKSICPLRQLDHFQLRSTRRWWKTKELAILFDHMPNATTITLFLCAVDSYLVHGNTLLSLLPSKLKHFHYAVFYAPLVHFDSDTQIKATWPASHPIACHHSDVFGFLYTLPWHSRWMSLPTSIVKVMSTVPAVDVERVRRLEVVVDKNLSLSKSFTTIARCPAIKHLLIFIDGGIAPEDQSRPVSLPVLSKLAQIYIYASTPIDFEQLSPILFVAPNLLRLDLPCDYLIRLLENRPLRAQLSQCLKSIAVLNATKSSGITLDEEHVHLIATSLGNLGDVYVDVTHLSSVTPSTIESMLRRLLVEFQRHKMISLVVDLQPFDEIKADVKRWLRTKTVLHERPFDAAFNEELNRIIIWM